MIEDGSVFPGNENEELLHAAGKIVDWAWRQLEPKMRQAAVNR